jgi:hypothetical protein
MEGLGGYREAGRDPVTKYVLTVTSGLGEVLEEGHDRHGRGVRHNGTSSHDNGNGLETHRLVPESSIPESLLTPPDQIAHHSAMTLW